MSVMQGVQHTQVPVRVVQQQQPPNRIATQPTKDANQSFRTIVFVLAIAEIVLGSVSMICGAALTGFIVDRVGCTRYCYIYFPPIGEGLWCGVFVILAGVIGILASGKNSNRQKVNAHMGLAITAAVFSSFHFTFNMITSFDYFYGVNTVFFTINGLCALASLVLCTTTAVYSCKLVSCCSQQPYSSFSNETQAIYYTNNRPTQQPIVQAVPQATQGYMLQTYQPVQPAMQTVQLAPQMTQQPMQPVMMMQPSFAYNQAMQQPSGSNAIPQQVGAVAQNPKNLEGIQESENQATEQQTSTNQSGPPAYSS